MGARVISESYSMDADEPGFIHVHYVRLLASGVDMGGPMWFARSNLRWVVDTMRACATTYAFCRAANNSSDDDLWIEETGPEQEPIINLSNRRPKTAAHGGAFHLAMTKPVAARFIAELGEIK
jgi:hypothetical protein